jgi:hypothetical protein
MSKLININVSAQTALFLQMELKEHIFKNLHDADSLSDFEGIGELIAELRTLQKLMVAQNKTQGAE